MKSVLLIGLTLLLSACGGGDSDTAQPGGSSTSSSSSSSSSSGSSTSSSSSSSSGASSSSSSSSSSGGSSTSSSSSSSSGGSVTVQQRVDAATATAGTNSSCTSIRPFYWEIGDATGKLAGGTESTSGTTPNENTGMYLYSASKWLFSTFALQKLGGDASLSASDVKALTMTSAYRTMNRGACTSSSTVASCDGSNNPAATTQTNYFAYDSGHMQHMGATNTNLGISADNPAALKTHTDAELGSDLIYTWTTPELAGGGFGSAADYAALLRRIIDPVTPLLMKAALGTHAVCTWTTDNTTCNTALNNGAVTAPQSQERWHYSLGHWVEDDPGGGDGAFSSPGAGGFYPWIDSSKSWYGVLARSANSGSTGSILCGRLIRKGWLTGVTQ